MIKDYWQDRPRRRLFSKPESKAAPDWLIALGWTVALSFMAWLVGG
jgi:hypothetical protein